MRLLGVFHLLLTALCPCVQAAHFRFTNMECKSLDTNFVEVRQCRLKLIQRNVAGMNFHLAIKYGPPIDKIQFNLVIFRKSNGYTLSLVNNSLDFCYYMRRPQEYPLFYIFHEPLMAATNANHTCPYPEKDIYLKKMIFNEQMVRKLPLPDGEYKLAVSVGAYSAWRLRVTVYGLRG